MSYAYDLSKIGPNEFENLVNFLALKVLGGGHNGFGPGPDGGRDGYFEGEAPYPSDVMRWKGTWYIQSKYHTPHLSKDPQKWLLQQVVDEISAFDADHSDRKWPDNWIIATNIDPTGKPETGSFDSIRSRLKKSRRGKKVNTHVWGGRKILDFLAQFDDVTKYYKHFLTPGHVLSGLMQDISDRSASIEEIIRYFVITQFGENLFTKLDQAGSSADVRPGVHDLFIDLPYRAEGKPQSNSILADITCAVAECQKYSLQKLYPDKWRTWTRQLRRARVSLLKGGPGQGKSTVGQYLCQIHRAHLILASDGPQAIEMMHIKAAAVREAAQRDHLWPTSARIPIQIELKEYAHWYSQITPSNTRNVLAYVASIVSQRLGFEVLVKTIKRALEFRSWIIVFDGLDEVPNDFKDKIANEVLFFLNDLLIEIDGDLFALCTSRPQGYSGQFAGLDGPTVELAHLDPETAMRCARPVLAFGRSADEMVMSFSTLETAIQSQNVRELMTTPLQSHIMAIVVRDGGRPPERRWQLFTSFYQVMKKRESLKNFQDPRIARLLREEDRLLKSVHMRLGFVLHARAERSEGAQTTLSKDDFRHLVRDVVAQLVDSEIEDTVNGVMEATTERLVLVSTPESGNHVRFDIRQLQEFFAAEFLYSGVDTEELASRIGTIGGDAHWREVMHFLMSSLIENQRANDLAVAVQVLRQINEGDSDSDSRLYCRRLARAGLLASRLLVEGVLEQDQRDRQQITPLLEPLMGIFDLSSLRNIALISPLRSRQWLIQVLIEKLGTASAREGVGAVLLLGWLLSDDDARGTSTINGFKVLPIGFQETLLVLWTPPDEFDFERVSIGLRNANDSLSLWVVSLAVQLLNSSLVLKYSTRTIHCLLKICRLNADRFVIACSMSNMCAEVANAAITCIDLSEEQNNNRRNDSSDEAIDCGILTGIPYPHNWTNGKLPDALRSIRAEYCASQSDGLFRFIFSCVAWAQAKDDGTLRAVLCNVDALGVPRVAAVPDQLLALIPISGPHALKPYSVEHLRNIDATQVDQMIKKLIQIPLLPQCMQFSVPSKETTPTDWQLFANLLPRIAIEFSLSPTSFRWPGNAEFVPGLTDLIEREPVLAGNCILGWGYLQKRQPALLELLKERIATFAVDGSSIEWQFSFHFPIRQFEAFKMNLPKDISLLAVLAPALVAFFSAPEMRMFHGVRGDTKPVSIQHVLKAYGLRASLLRDIAESTIHTRQARAGALAIYWLSLSESIVESTSPRANPIDLVAERALYVELVNVANEGWLTRALVKGPLSSFSETNEEALSLVRLLMEKCLDGNGPREEVITLVESWRERSTAPVTARELLQKWLGYSFKVPQYAR